MKNNKSWLMVLAVVAALTAAQTVRGITYGEADNGRHPNVGALMYIDYQNPVYPEVAWMNFSGILISPKVFLTAGHCSAWLEWVLQMGYADLRNYYVTFADDPYDQTYWWPIADVQTHPGYGAAKVTDVGFIDAHGLGSINIEDVGVVVLAEPASGIEPEELPSRGFLDALKDGGELKRDSKFIAVGYGSGATFPPPGPVYVPHNREMVTSEYLGVDKRWLSLSMNPVLENGGGGYGDSGGPRFWVNPDDLSEHLVSITSRGDMNLVTIDVTYRVDTLTALDFIHGVIDDLADSGALVLGLLGADAAAGTRPAALWPKGAELTVTFGGRYGGNLYLEAVSWPVASGADHYRITQAVIKGRGIGLDFNISPVTYTIGSDGRAYFSRYSGVIIPLPSLRVTVTAYDGPDETTAYSQTLSYRYQK